MSDTSSTLSEAVAAPVHREVGAEVRDDATLRVVVIRRSFAAPVEEVWEALTDPERLPRWFLPLTGDLSVGSRFQFQGNAGGVVRACLPPRRAEVTWEMGESPSVLELVLEPSGDGTELTLRHVADVEDTFWETYGPGAVGVGWDLAELGLDLHLRDPQQAVDGAAVMAWQTSPAGFAFVRRSCDAWVAASIEAGVPGEAARSAGANTYAFYTGTGDESGTGDETAAGSD